MSSDRDPLWADQLCRLVAEDDLALRSTAGSTNPSLVRAGGGDVGVCACFVLPQPATTTTKEQHRWQALFTLPPFVVCANAPAPSNAATTRAAAAIVIRSWFVDDFDTWPSLGSATIAPWFAASS